MDQRVDAWSTDSHVVCTTRAAARFLWEAMISVARYAERLAAFVSAMAFAARFAVFKRRSELPRFVQRLRKTAPYENLGMIC